MNGLCLRLTAPRRTVITQSFAQTFGKRCLPLNSQKNHAKGGSTVKKAAAILVSVLLYIGAFLLMFRVFMGDQILWFVLGFPVVTAIYFIIAGNLFAHYLRLNRWFLWLSMNFIGGLCSWIILLIWLPILLMNGMILFLMGPLVGVFAVVWAAVGLGFLCVKGLKGRGNSL